MCMLFMHTYQQDKTMSFEERFKLTCCCVGTVVHICLTKRVARWANDMHGLTNACHNNCVYTLHCMYS